MTTRVACEESSVDGQSTASGPAPVELERAAVLAALDLLAHLWRRPTAEEMATWDGVADLEEDLEGLLPVTRGRLSSLVEPVAMIDEYERLFVGPGPVSCSPYESVWRMDVPVDIRGSLMGPCTVELRRLYGELGLELAPSRGQLPDHLTVEIEALTYALSSENGIEVARSLFFDHLKTWVPRLCRATLHAAEHPFYQELALTTLDWLGPLGRWLDAGPTDT